MKLTYPADAPFAVDVPGVDLFGVEPGSTVDVDDVEVAESLIAQGWQAEKSKPRVPEPKNEV